MPENEETAEPNEEITYAQFIDRLDAVEELYYSQIIAIQKRIRAAESLRYSISRDIRNGLRMHYYLTPEGNIKYSSEEKGRLGFQTENLI